MIHPAIQFLQHFGEDHFIQTFDDKKKSNRTALSERRTKSAADLKKAISSLQQLNVKHNAGIYFCVNQLKPKARRVSDNVTAITALFLDLDGAPVDPVLEWALTPNLVVHTSADRYHCYWVLDDDYPEALKLFKNLQRWLADKFGGDRSIIDLCRVMRVPGFFNMKHDPFMVSFKEYRKQPYKLKEITDVYEADKSDPGANAVRSGGDKPLGSGVLPDWVEADFLAADAGRGGIKNMLADLVFNADRLRGALLSIPADDYEVWLRVGMALQGAAVREDAEMSLDEAFEWWTSWSATSPKYDEGSIDQKWEGLNARGEVGLGTVYELAQQHGWKGRGAKSWSVDEWIKNEEERGRVVARVKIDMTTPEGRAKAARYGIK